ncbi:hypothetical protein C815_02140 [Firmicutes bacterium M10-2]|nr:hypothetical protein C815_02140 [Firmicutes bacterium M10-2]
MVKLKNILILFVSILSAAFIFGTKVISVEQAKDLKDTNFEDPTLRVIAHRGASANLIEHTFQSYEQAIKQGCRQIELDVYRSKDGTLYVSHDPTTLRLTGKDYIINDTNDEALSALTVANGERLHTVQEFFNHFGNKVLYLIELKEGTPALDNLQQLIEKNPKLKKNIMVQTWDTQSLIALDSRYPEMFKQLLLSSNQDIASYVKCSWIDSFAVDYSKINQQDVDLAHSHGKQFWGWTINQPQDIQHCKDIGVDGVITDCPDQALLIMDNQ